jgi:D-aminopeptidase
MIVIARDALVNERKLQRISKRASFGLSRKDSHAAHGSGDIVIFYSSY